MQSSHQLQAHKLLFWPPERQPSLGPSLGPSGPRGLWAPVTHPVSACGLGAAALGCGCTELDCRQVSMCSLGSGSCWRQAWRLGCALEGPWGGEVTGELQELRSPGPAFIVSCRQASAII